MLALSISLRRTGYWEVNRTRRLCKADSLRFTYFRNSPAASSGGSRHDFRKSHTSDSSGAKQQLLDTFCTEATTVRAVPDGVLTIVNRVGTTTIFFTSNPAPRNPIDRSTFCSGTPVQVSSYQQQVVVDNDLVHKSCGISALRPQLPSSGPLGNGRGSQARRARVTGCTHDRF